MRLIRLVAVLGSFWLPTLSTGQEFDPYPSFFDAQSKPQSKEQLKPIAPVPETIGNIELKDDLKEYPIWLMIQPQGVRFLQSDEEIAIHQNQIPANAFLIGCHEAEFKAVSDAKDRSFQLDCKDFALLGSYGTKQHVEIKGASLAYSTQSQQVELTGDKELPLEYRLSHLASESVLKAERITLSLLEDRYRTTATNVELIEIYHTSSEPGISDAPSTRTTKTNKSNPFDPFPSLSLEN
jgi:hypothetical protein